MKVPEAPEFSEVVHVCTRASLLESPLHGKKHWFKVYANCRILKPGDEFRKFFFAFAMLHDCRREMEFQDEAHGYLASLTVPEYPVLRDAIQYHSLGATTDDPLMGVCWDADRLELPRVGTRVRTKFLSTDAGVKLAKERGGYYD